MDSDLERVLDAALQLSRPDLEKLHAIIGGLLEATERSNQPIPGERRGTIEWKTIRNKKQGKDYGPYPYLRYWQDGKLKSKYLKDLPTHFNEP